MMDDLQGGRGARREGSGEERGGGWEKVGPTDFQEARGRAAAPFAQTAGCPSKRSFLLVRIKYP